ncbi:hypothetical protein BJ878DRAFT_256985 [Calycina marina]|uniref:Uncharacterized protein n=1 Tax=Calycina marina TaxID=1763456 RepID=A0A9P7YWI2_9HELO|nr:hypothetical protein BJ878DRAFT_256985 [Calycina marina]
MARESTSIYSSILFNSISLLLSLAFINFTCHCYRSSSAERINYANFEPTQFLKDNTEPSQCKPTVLPRSRLEHIFCRILSDIYRYLEYLATAPKHYNTIKRPNLTLPY